MYRRKQREFVCDTCGKDFHKESQLKKHVYDAHHPELNKPIIEKSKETENVY